MIASLRTLSNDVVQRHGHGWMLTLVDLVSLLLTFFVLQLAMSSPPATPAPPTADVAELSFVAGDPVVEGPVALKGLPAGDDGTQKVSLAYVARFLERTATGNLPPGVAKFRAAEDRLVAVIPPSVIFSPQSGELNQDALALFAAISPLIGHIPLSVAVAVDAGALSRDGSAGGVRSALAAATTVVRAFDGAGGGPESAAFAMTLGSRDPVVALGEAPLPSSLSRQPAIIFCVCGARS